MTLIRSQPGPNADVIILTGPPGSGKSTIARKLARTYRRSVHLHTDDFWHYISSGGIAPYLPEAGDQNQVVMQVVRHAAFTFAAGGYTTIIDGIIGQWMLDHFPNDGELGLHLQYVVLRPSRAEALRRAQARTAPGALVEEGPILSMWDQFADLAELEPYAIDTTAQDQDRTLASVQEIIASGRSPLSRRRSQ